MQMNQRSLWKGSSFVGKISPGWTEISSNVTQRSLKKEKELHILSFCMQYDCQFSRHAKTKVCKGNKRLHVQREVKTSVIAVQKYDYIF